MGGDAVTLLKATRPSFEMGVVKPALSTDRVGLDATLLAVAIGRDHVIRGEEFHDDLEVNEHRKGIFAP
jgi:hypothetical protein